YSAPLITRSFLMQYYGNKTPSVTIPTSLFDFIVKVFTAMSLESKELLQKSLGFGLKENVIYLLEQTWQKEFYRIGQRQFGHCYFLSCDVGATFACDGYINFYVGGQLKS
ncbi:11243_t:CDS:1, partial [Diversispora eburnea]